MARVKTVINERRVVANYMKSVAHVKKRVIQLKYFVTDSKKRKNLYHNIVMRLNKAPKWRRMKSEASVRKQHMQYRNFYAIRKYEKEAIVKDLQDWKSQNQRKSILEKLGSQILESKSDQTPPSQTAQTQSYDPYARAMDIVKIFEQKRLEAKQAKLAANAESQQETQTQ